MVESPSNWRRIVPVSPETRTENRRWSPAPRETLPELLPHRDAAHTACRAALLGAALASGRVDLLAAVNKYVLVSDLGRCKAVWRTFFNVGQYFSDVGSGSAYQSRFGTSWLKTGSPDRLALPKNRAQSWLTVWPAQGSMSPSSASCRPRG